MQNGPLFFIIKRDVLKANLRPRVVIRDLQNRGIGFVGNLPIDATVRDLEKLFSRYGRVDRVDLKTGFAFVYLDGDLNEAVRALDDTRFYDTPRRMRIEIAKGDGAVKR
jgi:RNA recognition motif-containing protein